MNKRNNILFLVIICTVLLGACSPKEKGQISQEKSLKTESDAIGTGTDNTQRTDVDSDKKKESDKTNEYENNGSISWHDLVFKKSTDILYANQFTLEEASGYRLITIVNSGRFLLINNGDEIPTDLPEDIIVVEAPLKSVYLQASSAFDPITKIGAIKHITLSGIKEEDMYIEEVKSAMKSGAIKYAGKYSAPDYELILTSGCDLAILSTMVYHNPEVKEKLEKLRIPVMVEKSSYESNPMGRLEWIKLYGFLFDEMDAANAYFEEQVKVIEEVAKTEKSDKTIAFFHVNSNGGINVRKPGDYIVKLIEMAGGNYALSNITDYEENSLSTMNIQMEDFYLYAKDADYLIYNSTIVGEILSIDELIEKNQMFADFSAVKNGQVYCTERDFFQESTGMGKLLSDINNLIFNEDENDFYYLKRLE